MKKQRVYVDTSVIGGCFDDEFSVWSHGLMNDFRQGHFVPVTSVNLEQGYKQIQIFSPREVTTYDDE